MRDIQGYIIKPLPLILKCVLSTVQKYLFFPIAVAVAHTERSDLWVRVCSFSCMIIPIKFPILSQNVTLTSTANKLYKPVINTLRTGVANLTTKYLKESLQKCLLPVHSLRHLIYFSIV